MPATRLRFVDPEKPMAPRSSFVPSEAGRLNPALVGSRLVVGPAESLAAFVLQGSAARPAGEQGK